MAKNKIKIHFLGTNGWYASSTGNAICVLIDAPEAYVLLDAGDGIYKADKYIKDNKPIYLLLSHLHLDHIAGLHILAKFNFKQAVHIFIHKSLVKDLKTILQKKYTMPLATLPFKACLVTNPKKLKFLENIGLLIHPVPSYGFRLRLGGKTITYVADTGMCATALSLSRGSDLLISECAFKTGTNFKEWPHLNPETAALIAKKSGTKKLVLVHFDAFVYQTLKEREKAGQIAKGTFKNTVVAKDDMELKV